MTILLEVTILHFTFACGVLAISLFLDLKSTLKQLFHKVFTECFAGEVLALLLPDDSLTRRLINIAHTGCHMKYKKVKTL